ncbi:hypothetical protein LOC71_02420 [Rhodopirellula sp. JC740]|uniref:Secreted protein n=1 Tax=Rhodopirellula halodulae TaxID=2894198 RepID=A0ABS8NC27_9BACT|nr:MULTISPECIES: hypothetical protein [unclassified Rhodopirellula]MCC9641112.1 hypothetical protein [Rhodopirellula sp. JC740]MCC9655140.1 hypothetical protein [Rhodopirellula sp. JC737]
MSRFCYSTMFALGLIFSTAGCGGGSNEVIEDTRTPAEIEQEQAEYEQQMEESMNTGTNS